MEGELANMMNGQSIEAEVDGETMVGKLYVDRYLVLKGEYGGSVLEDFTVQETNDKSVVTEGRAPMMGVLVHNLASPESDFAAKKDYR